MTYLSDLVKYNTQYGTKISCVGGTSEQEMQKGQINDNIACYIWKDNVISVQNSKQLFADVIRGRDEPHNPTGYSIQK